ncbi:hypothetical protein [Pseudarthrobacter quantipunctorum]|uniref:Response regulatory domain-containing protein n=1 Tax=Pseudarthrobacter quantipunctorum TaxID=3128980 RepID=A0ABZ2R132_9MICC
MYTPARFVVIDDNPTHLHAIKTTIESLGSTCLDVLYRPEEEISPFLLRGARVVFMDFHLSGLTFASDPKMDNATIASILTSTISESNQPYLLVIWTKFPDQAAQLEQFLRDRLAKSPHVIPMAVLCISKDTFINIDSGEVQDPEQLRAEVSLKIREHPSLAALLDWEYTVHKSASRISSKLTGLIPNQAFSAGTTRSELDIVLSRFAVSNGKSGALTDPRSAFAYAVGPLLADEILHADEGKDNRDVWQKGTTQAANQLPALSDVDAARFNRMAHISPPSAESFSSSDWGAVVRIEEENEAWFRRYLDLTPEEVWECLGVDVKEREDAVLVMVRAGAQCDFAQQKSGPVPYLVGGLVRPRKTWKKKPAASVKRSVSFLNNVDTEEESMYQLHVDTRLSVTFTTRYAKRWAPVLRLREPLMSQILSLHGTHSTRPGILQFR